MKILWFSNFAFKELPVNATGSWLYSMGSMLMNTSNVELYNITFGTVSKTVRNDYRKIAQWIVPTHTSTKQPLPNKKTIMEIQQIVKFVNPDIVHIWGMECYWGLLSTRNIIKGKILLEIQGIKLICADVFCGGLSLKSTLSCIGMRELIKPKDSIIIQKLEFKKWGTYEIEMLRNHAYISTQSDWVRAHVHNINSSVKIFNTKMALREEFINSTPWNFPDENKLTLFTVFSSLVPYKGLHILIRALAVLKEKYPNVALNIAGNVFNKLPFYRKPGYTKYIENLINQLDLDSNLNFLGPIDANSIVMQMNKSHVYVIPSFVESYCLALAEGMAYGIPCVVSYAGAMSELAKDEDSALFFSPGDYIKCAYQIERLYKSKDLSIKISKEARRISSARHNCNDVINTQMNIYMEIIRT